MKAYATGALLGIALIGLAACGGGDDKKDSGGDAPKGGDAATEGDSGGGKQAYDASEHAGSVSGVVKWGGAAMPAPVPISVSSDKFCTDAWEGRQMLDERFVVNADGTIPNVFIYPAKGPHKGFTDFAVPDDFVVTQKDCLYVPHVFGVMKDQKFTVKNDDGTLHNVKVSPSRNPEANLAQGPGGSDTLSFEKTEKKIPFSCDVHSWMNATAWCMSHPFFATSDASGKFEIKGLPDGEYTFSAWHEIHGEAEATVTVSGGAETVEITISGE